MPQQKVRVWDLPTRAFHWSLVVLVLLLIITGKIGNEALVWHGRLGYAVFALLLFRIMWGFVGGHYSRFASFFPTPQRLKAYLSLKDSSAWLGHNPLGALSVFAMLGLLCIQVVSGLFTDDEIAFTGPLTSLVANKWVSFATHWHKVLGESVLIALILLHVAAILFYLFKRKHNLIKPMLTGDTVTNAQDAQAARDGVQQGFIALALLAASAALVWWVVNLGAK